MFQVKRTDAAALALAAALVVAGTGCSTTSGLLEHDPEAFSSSKPAQDLVVCLSDTWAKRNQDVRVHPMAGGQRIIINNPALHGTIAIVEVRPADSGSQALYWKGAGLTGWTREDLQGCL